MERGGGGGVYRERGKIWINLDGGIDLAIRLRGIVGCLATRLEDDGW